MAAIIINYAVRAVVVVLGILLVSGAFKPENADDTLFRVMGAVFILFGTYRIVMYYFSLKRYRRENSDD